MEGLRTDSLMLGQMRVSQLLAAVCVLAGGVAYVLLRNRHNALPKDLFAAEKAPDGQTPDEPTAEEPTRSEGETDNGDPA